MISHIVADLHCHTLASTHAYSTVTELAAQAAKVGLEAIAVTDHGSGIQDAPHLWHFMNLNCLPTHIDGVRILHGVEANVSSFTGDLGMPGRVLERLDIVVASMHEEVMPYGDIEQCTAAWLAVAENPYVTIIGHSGAPCFAYDYEKVIPVFGKNGKIVEINENSFGNRPHYISNCRRIAELCKQYRVRITVDSDAHYHTALGQVPLCLQMLAELDFPEELIVNGSKDAFHSFLQERNI